jgi:hypothetical protein
MQRIIHKSKFETINPWEISLSFEHILDQKQKYLQKPDNNKIAKVKGCTESKTCRKLQTIIIVLLFAMLQAKKGEA